MAANLTTPAAIPARVYRRLPKNDPPITFPELSPNAPITRIPTPHPTTAITTNNGSNVLNISRTLSHKKSFRVEIESNGHAISVEKAVQSAPDFPRNFQHFVPSHPPAPIRPFPTYDLHIQVTHERNDVAMLDSMPTTFFGERTQMMFGDTIMVNRDICTLWRVIAVYCKPPHTELVCYMLLNVENNKSFYVHAPRAWSKEANNTRGWNGQLGN
jgi:hypothetical protein